MAAAFDDFIAAHNTFSATQLRFLQTLRTFVIQRGAVAKKDLVAAPFSRVHPQGIRGVFPTAEIEEILELTAKLVA